MGPLESANKLKSQGRMPQALHLLENADIQESEQGPALAALAEMYLHAGNPSRTLDCATQARNLGHEPLAMLHVQALANRVLGQEQKSRSYAEQILATDPCHQGAKDLMLLLDGQSIRPETREKVLRLQAKKSPLIISIRSPSDKECDPAMRRMWGDHWVKEELSIEFRKLGLTTSDRNPDIILQLFGSPPKKLPENTYNIVWVYSHPDMINPRNIRPFDKITCAAVSFISKLDSFGYLNSEFMPACTSKTPFKAELIHDMIFLGNARRSRSDGRKVVMDMRTTNLDFKVWGNLWEQLLPSENYGGLYWDYERLEELYASARITLNDHHPDMAREGFISNKVFDILASGGFLISQANTGLKSVFGDSVPQYETPDQLKKLASYYLNNPPQREALMQQGQKIALSHTYRKCAEQFLSGLRG
ncbi:MAG: glycosyltransferase [Desulfatibacillum sp.]|nr:glycosyltransferase [Desulfatibacillum sp.]